jgi:hypothetical protein
MACDDDNCHFWCGNDAEASTFVRIASRIARKTIKSGLSGGRIVSRLTGSTLPVDHLKSTATLVIHAFSLLASHHLPLKLLGISITSDDREGFERTKGRTTS